MAEYEGLLLALRKARAVGARRLVILTDSELIADHIGKTYKAKKPDMMKYLQAVRRMQKFFLNITVKSFLRHYNKEAAAIAKATALLEPLPPDVFYERQNRQCRPRTLDKSSISSLNSQFGQFSHRTLLLRFSLVLQFTA
jgi:hypothetical protein